MKRATAVLLAALPVLAAAGTAHAGPTPGDGAGARPEESTTSGAAPPESSTSPAPTTTLAGETAAGSDDFAARVVASGLENPFEVLVGPGGTLWVTERTAGRVTEVDPSSGETATLLAIPDVLSTGGEQDGLLGMALQPGFLDAPAGGHVFLSYTYDGDPGEVLDRRQRLVRYTYDEEDGSLGEPVELIAGLLASDDHNSGRLAFGPDEKLHYTIGDRGNNQDLNACRENMAQLLPTAEQVEAGDWTAYQGKTLRLEQDGSVPEDNPVIDGVRSHVFTYGHRNAQGLVFTPDGALYASEQGPKSDDELNRLVAGGNYGWPFVAGYKDDSAYVYGNWSARPGCDPEEYDAFVIPEDVPQVPESAFHDPALVPPLRTFYTVPPEYDFVANTERCAPLAFICYPTVAPSNLDVYTGDAIPGWSPSLLMTTLKTGAVFRLPLVDAGEGGPVVDGPVPLWESVDRYRDTAVSPDGATIYVATDSQGIAGDEAGLPTDELANPGAILAFEYQPAGAGPDGDTTPERG